jgi:hypothetical protein
MSVFLMVFCEKCTIWSRANNNAPYEVDHLLLNYFSDTLATRIFLKSFHCCFFDIW